MDNWKNVSQDFLAYSLTSFQKTKPKNSLHQKPTLLHIGLLHLRWMKQKWMEKLAHCAVAEPMTGHNLASRWASWAEDFNGVADKLFRVGLEASNMSSEEFLTGLISVQKNVCDCVELLISKEAIWHHSVFSNVPLYEYVNCGCR